MNSRWLHCELPREEASLRLFCFPHAGGGPQAHRGWSEALQAVLAETHVVGDWAVEVSGPPCVHVYDTNVLACDVGAPQVVSVSLPGRGVRFNEEYKFDSVRDLAVKICDEIETLCTLLPYVFFGHSFGALLAYEVPFFSSGAFRRHALSTRALL